MLNKDIHGFETLQGLNNKRENYLPLDTIITGLRSNADGIAENKIYYKLIYYKLIREKLHLLC